MKNPRSALRIAFSCVLLVVIVYAIASNSRGCENMDRTSHKPMWKTGTMTEPKESEVAMQSLINA